MRILWLAQADARGHLMRVQLLARPLRQRGIEIDWVTTSEEGASFLRAFGLSARVPSGARWLACVGAIAGVSLVDSVGATMRGLGLMRGSATQDAPSLSYHSDADRFAA